MPNSVLNLFNVEVGTGNIWFSKRFLSRERGKMSSKLYELHSKRWNFYGPRKIGISCWRTQKWIESYRISNLNQWPAERLTTVLCPLHVKSSLGFQTIIYIIYLFPWSLLHKPTATTPCSLNYRKLMTLLWNRKQKTSPINMFFLTFMSISYSSFYILFHAKVPPMSLYFYYKSDQPKIDQNCIIEGNYFLQNYSYTENFNENLIKNGSYNMSFFNHHNRH